MLRTCTGRELGAADTRLSAAIGIGCAIAMLQRVYWIEGGNRRFSSVELVHIGGKKRGKLGMPLLGHFGMVVVQCICAFYLGMSWLWAVAG